VRLAHGPCFAEDDVVDHQWSTLGAGLPVGGSPLTARHLHDPLSHSLCAQ
jgi:hypothetical protein